MGDAILCTPALRAVRQHLQSSKISFLANPVVQQVLSPCDFNDYWLGSLNAKDQNPFAVAKKLRPYEFTQAILFKNSFACALAVFLAGIPTRIGYAREGRGPLLSERLYPPKTTNGKFKPVSMIDYYLAIAGWIGADTDEAIPQLPVDPADERRLHAKLPALGTAAGPIVILVPGGAFGSSKCWPADRFAKTADWLIDNYNTTVVICVAPNPTEKQIAERICAASKNTLVSLAQRPLSLGQLKALFASADLVISNDTGPRHIAIALKRKVVTLFGPNNPAWTNTNYDAEVQIAANVDCAPCQKARCKKPSHLCMEVITTDMVCNAAAEVLDNLQG